MLKFQFSCQNDFKFTILAIKNDKNYHLNLNFSSLNKNQEVQIDTPVAQVQTAAAEEKAPSSPKTTEQVIVITFRIFFRFLP